MYNCKYAFFIMLYVVSLNITRLIIILGNQSALIRYVKFILLWVKRDVA